MMKGTDMTKQGIVNQVDHRKLLRKSLWIVIGNLSYAAGVNLMINPLHFYSGGFTGIAQLIRMFLVDVLRIPQIPGVDYLGIIYFLINVPFFLLALRVMGRRFCVETLISIVMASAFLTMIPIPKVPLVKDPMLAVMVGGLGSGFGAGIVLRAGSSQGGQDLIGICLAKTHPNFKVGNIGIMISVAIYTICLFVYDVQTVLYSIIFAVVTGVLIDRVHTQNIKLEAMIFTKKEGMAQAIMTEMRRGVTDWDGEGAYTKENSHVLVTVISKYEEPALRQIIAKYDSQAFVILVENARVIGNFEKRFTD